MLAYKGRPAASFQVIRASLHTRRFTKKVKQSVQRTATHVFQNASAAVCLHELTEWMQRLPMALFQNVCAWRPLYIQTQRGTTNLWAQIVHTTHRLLQP